jgi:serine/threonine protein kinase
VIPSAAFLLLLLLCLFVVLLVIIRRKGRTSDDWEIEYSELEVGEQLGAGGYGEVHKAVCKGTEVAVKVMAREKFTKEMEKNFKDEVRTLDTTRHDTSTIAHLGGVSVRRCA